MLIRCRNCGSVISHNITKHRALNKQDSLVGYWKMATSGAVRSGFRIMFDKLEPIKGKQWLNVVDRRNDGGHDFAKTSRGNHDYLAVQLMVYSGYY